MPDAPAPIALAYYAAYSLIGLILCSFVVAWLRSPYKTVKIFSALTIAAGILLLWIDFMGSLLLFLNIVPLSALVGWEQREG